MWWLILFSFTITEAQVTDIAKARTLRSGTVVTVAGRVTVGKEFGDLSFMQDGTGGIAVYDAAMDRGDSVVLTGKIARFNGLVEIIPDSVWKMGQRAEILPREVDPRRVVEHEGELVRIKSASLKPPNHFFYPQRSGFLTKGSDSLNYWIDGDTNIPGYLVPAGATSITGVVGRFKDQLQILPRSIEDIPGVIPYQNPTEPGSFSVMNWNIEFFGAARYGPSNDELQLANVSKIIHALKPCVVALQEVSDDTAFKNLLKALPGYEGRCSSRYSYSFDTSGDFPPQKLCFVYRTEIVKVVREKILFRKFYDEHPDMSEIFSSGRLPYLLEADVTNRGITERVSFINYHGKSGDEADDLARREFDAKLLRDTLGQFYPGRKMILLGDFNDDVDTSITDGRPSPYSVLKNFECVSKKLSEQNWHSTISYDDVIDHQFVSSSMIEDFISTQLVNPFILIQKYDETTSDHLPVLSQFQWKMVTGIEEESEVVIFPNPAREILKVWGFDYFEYRIFNAVGICIANGFTNDQITLNIPPGIYNLVIHKGPISRAFKFIRSD